MKRESNIFLLSYLLISIGLPAHFLFGVKKADPVTGTIMVSFFFITSAILGITFSRLSDKLMKRKIFVLGGFFLLPIIFLGYFFASSTSPIQMITAAGVFGIAYAAYVPNALALFTEMEPTLPRGKLMSYFHVVASAGWAIGALLGGIIDQFFGDFVFIFAVVMTIIGSFIFSLKIHDIPPYEEDLQDSNSLNSSPLNSNFQLYSILIIILSLAVLTRHLCVQGGYSLFPNYLEEDLGVDALTISIVIGINMMVQSIIMIPIGRLTDFFGRKIMLLLGIIGSTLVFLIFSFIRMPWLLIFPQMLMGFSWPASITSATALVTDITSRRNRSRGMGWLNVGFSIGGSAGPLVAGFLLIQFETNYNIVFQILTIFPLIGILLILITFSENRRKHEYKLFRKSRKDECQSP